MPFERDVRFALSDIVFPGALFPLQEGQICRWTPSRSLHFKFRPNGRLFCDAF